MRELFRSRGFKVMIAVILILLAVILYTASTGQAFTASLFGLVSTPMQQISGAAVDAAGNVIANKSPEQLRAENEQLRAELNKKNNELIDYYKVKAENNQYRQYLQLKEENPDYKFVSATKIGSDPNENFYGFTIDKGSVHGVKKNDPVITAAGLVGYVSDVGATYAKVKTILDAAISVGGHDARTRDGGIVSGTVELADEGLTKMRYISNQHQMEAGDIICTSGLGGIYPYGLPIGVIREIRPEEHDISLYALIAPVIDIRKVTDVLVIISFEGQGEVVEEDITPQRGAYATGEDGDMTVTASDAASSGDAASGGEISSGEPVSSDSSSGASSGGGQ